MVEEFHFRGIQSAREMSVSLINFDTKMDVLGDYISLTETYFPDAYKNGERIHKCSEEIMKEYISVMHEIGIPDDSEIPMMYFVNTIKYCANKYGIFGKKIYFPGREEWRDSILNSGYVAAERIYFNVPIG